MRSRLNHMSYTSMWSDFISKREFHERRNSFFQTPHRLHESHSAKDTPVKAAVRSTQTLDTYPIIAHCHLCWDWVWQRPQQFLSRLSQNHRVLFVETRPPDPNLVTPLARCESVEDFPNLTLLRIQFPASRWGDAAYVDLERRRLVQEALRGPLAGQFENPVQWFYDPMAVTAFGGHLGEIAIVYDCMDELSQFRGAPTELATREGALLSRADVVFAGGRKLHEAKSRRHPNCHFYGCGVDLEHFGRARNRETVVPPDLSHLPKPVLGYFGVVDERLDYDLIARLADANPRGSVVMIGPVIKVEERSLPRRRNLHWLGGRDYSQLPAYCKGFNLCLMPFALNPATEFINPTKALEYMATGRMIVSSAVPDVVRNFGEVVKIAAGPDEFISLCGQAVAQPDRAVIERGLQMAAGNSWESIVEQLEKHVEEALARHKLRVQNQGVESVTEPV
jgi:glycosyltransferase involved in cell wall biosynthesis